MKTYIFPVVLLALLSSAIFLSKNEPSQNNTKVKTKIVNNDKGLANTLAIQCPKLEDTISKSQASIAESDLTKEQNNQKSEISHKVRKHFISKQFEYDAIHNNKGIIGSLKGRSTDNPIDNVFHFDITELFSQNSKAYIEYDLYGVKDQNSVTKGINNNYSYGGRIIEKDTTWSKQKEEINIADIKMGHNIIRFSTTDEVKYGYEIKNIKLLVDNKHLTKGKELIVNQPISSTLHQQYGYINGYVKGVGAEKARVFINGKEIRNNNGSYETLAKSDTINPKQLKVEVLAIFTDGSRLIDSVYFDKVSDYDFVCNGEFTNETKITDLQRSDSINIKINNYILKAKKN